MPKIFFTDLTEVTRKLQSAIKQLLRELRAAESLRGGLLVLETIAAHCEVAGLAPPPVFNEQTLDDFLTDCQQRLLDLSLERLECRAPEPPGVTINNLVHRWLFLPEKVDAWVVFAAGTGAYEKAGTVADGVLKPLSPSPLTLITLKEGKAPSVRNYSVEEDLKELPTEMKAAYSAARAASRLRPSFSLVPGQPPSPSMADVVVGGDRLAVLTNTMAAVAGCELVAPPPEGSPGGSNGGSAWATPSAAAPPPARPTVQASGLAVRAVSMGPAALPLLDRSPQAVVAGSAGAGPSTPSAAGPSGASQGPPPTDPGSLSWAEIDGLSLEEIVGLLG